MSPSRVEANESLLSCGGASRLARMSGLRLPRGTAVIDERIQSGGVRAHLAQQQGAPVGSRRVDRDSRLAHESLSDWGRPAT